MNTHSKLLNKEILRLAVPNILSNISVPLLSTVDTALMGRLSAEHLGAVGLSSMLFNFIYWNFGFLRMGTTGMTAQAFGAENKVEMTAVLTRGLALSLLLAVLIFGLQMYIFDLSVGLLNVQDHQVGMVREYFDIRIFGVLASFALFCFMGWFFGMQNAVIPLIITIVINVINMALSALLVYQYDMGIRGVALGTVVSQYIGFGLALFFFLTKYREQAHAFKLSILKNYQALIGYLRINSDIFIRTVCLTFAFGFFYSMSSKGGAMILAVNVILLQFLNWMSYGIDGFAYASESLVGKYKGKKDQVMTHRSIVYSFGWGLAFALFFSLVYGLGGPFLLAVFTDESDVIAAAIPYLKWIVMMPVIAFGCYIWDGIFIGLTASKAMRNSMLISLIAYFGVFYLGKDHFPIVTWLWFSLMVFLAARGLIQFVYYRRYGWEMQ